MTNLLNEDNSLINELWKLVYKYWKPNEVFGHGPNHAIRILEYGKHLAKEEQVDDFIIKLSCLLVDSGLNPIDMRNNHIERSINISKALLVELNLPTHVINKVKEAIKYHSASKAIPSSLTLEARIVRDSDILDRLGYTGIEMTLKYGLYINRKLYNPKHISFPEKRSLDLNKYTLDYIYFLFTLEKKLSLRRSKEIAKLKIIEIEKYIEKFKNYLSKYKKCTYADAFEILGPVSKTISQYY